MFNSNLYKINYSWFSLCRSSRDPSNEFEIAEVRDKRSSKFRVQYKGDNWFTTIEYLVFVVIYMYMFMNLLVECIVPIFYFEYRYFDVRWFCNMCLYIYFTITSKNTLRNVIKNDFTINNKPFTAWGRGLRLSDDLNYHLIKSFHLSNNKILI